MPVLLPCGCPTFYGNVCNVLVPDKGAWSTLHSCATLQRWKATSCSVGPLVTDQNQSERPWIQHPQHPGSEVFPDGSEWSWGNGKAWSENVHRSRACRSDRRWLFWLESGLSAEQVLLLCNPHSQRPPHAFFLRGQHRMQAQLSLARATLFFWDNSTTTPTPSTADHNSKDLVHPSASQAFAQLWQDPPVTTVPFFVARYFQAQLCFKRWQKRHPEIKSGIAPSHSLGFLSLCSASNFFL